MGAPIAQSRAFEALQCLLKLLNCVYSQPDRAKNKLQQSWSCMLLRQMMHVDVYNQPKTFNWSPKNRWQGYSRQGYSRAKQADLMQGEWMCRLVKPCQTHASFLASGTPDVTWGRAVGKLQQTAWRQPPCGLPLPSGTGWWGIWKRCWGRLQLHGRPRGRILTN